MRLNISKLFIFMFSFAFSMAGFAQQTVQVQASQGLADNGSAAESLYNTALIHVIVHGDGGPMTALGTTAGNGASGISLPSGWSIRTMQVPAGGCNLRPTQFHGTYDGYYSIRVLTASSRGTCKWKTGEYHVLIRYQEAGFDRSGMAMFTIK